MLSDDSGNVIELIQEAYAVKKTKQLYSENMIVHISFLVKYLITLDFAENSLQSPDGASWCTR